MQQSVFFVILYLFFVRFTFSKSSFFHNIPKHKGNPILELEKEFKEDQSPNKVNLAIGSYLDEFGNPFVFQSIRKVEELITTNTQFATRYYENNNITLRPKDGLFDKDYLPTLGFNLLSKKVETLIFGVSKANRNLVSFQTGSSSEGLSTILGFLNKFVVFDAVALSNPTYLGYESIIKSKCPGKNILYYRYTKTNQEEDKELDFEGMVNDLKNLPNRTIVILQSNCHNPTGLDPSIEQWKKIATIFDQKELFPLIDAAYLGFSSGNFEKDSEMINLFNQLEIEFGLTVSFSKNLGLYGERVGYSAIKTLDYSLNTNISSQIESFSTIPPLMGARDAYFALEYFHDEWTNELFEATERIKRMRIQLFEELQNLGRIFKHILNENGFFTNLKINKSSVDYLKREHHVYIVPQGNNGGRLNIAGLNEKNVKYVAWAIDDALKK